MPTLLNTHTVALDIHTVALNIHTVALNIHSLALNIHTVTLNVHSIALNIKVGRYVGLQKNTIKHMIKYDKIRYKTAYFAVFLPDFLATQHMCQPCLTPTL